MPTPTLRIDPYNGYNFSVEIDGLTRAGFRTCSGLDSTTASTAYREGTDVALVSRALPGLTTFGHITLTRGITNDRALWNWRAEIVAGADLSRARKNVSIILLDNTGAEKIRWNLSNSWPARWTGPSFDAASDGVAIETLELAHEGIEVQQWS